jgi:sensor histidine kinase regulating citrate/malate metabolism
VEVSRVRQVEAMDRLMRSQHDQYLASQRSMDEVNRKYHDLKHYLQAIRAEENPAARGEYLDHLERSIQPYETQVQTGNRVLDVVLSSHLAECADLGIVMTCVADGALLEPLGAMDLSVLIGNALDNAIEATQKVPEPDRRLIRVAVYAQGAS